MIRCLHLILRIDEYLYILRNHHRHHQISRGVIILTLQNGSALDLSFRHGDHISDGDAVNILIQKFTYEVQEPTNLSRRLIFIVQVL